MDFYWLYSSKEIIDPAGKSNFFKAIEVASQDKLSKHSSQVDLLKELLNLQKDMVIMMLSMLEGNVVNGTIGKQMVDTLVESASNVEELIANHDGTITPREFKEKMEQMKNYTLEEINFLLMCCDTNHDGKIDYVEFTERFHNPAKEIGFNLATAGSVLNYFENFLGRIEIMGGCKRIERVYFEINEDNIEQWEKPQIKESKRAFFHSIVTEGDKEKLEAFVNFCEDAIFEMQHAAALVEEETDNKMSKGCADAVQFIGDDEEERTGMDLIKFQIAKGKQSIVDGLSLLSPSNIKKKIKELKQLSSTELAIGFVKMMFMILYYGGFGVVWVMRKMWATMMRLMQGPPQEKS
ncbi:Ryanodine receptor [Armadillidium vulgare]|nr:Ryanodine receptor [Armadillidium vulgare]